MKRRSAEVTRKTTETSVEVSLCLDGRGTFDGTTSVPFLDHMLNLLAKHGDMDLKVDATGDVEVDRHHTVEDVGIALGKAFAEAVGTGAGIERFGSATVPMSESLSTVAVDVSGRPHLVVRTRGTFAGADAETLDMGLVEEFLLAFVTHARFTIHVNLLYGKNLHHCVESIFKSLARALKAATCRKGRRRGIPSTKGTL